MIPINILLVDDHLLFSKSLSIALEEYDEIENFYFTQEIEQIEQLIKSKEIDIILMDINLKNLCDGDGLSIASDLLKAAPRIKIILLTGYDLPVYKHEARKMGICGFLNKNISPDILFDSLKRVFQGHSCFPPENDDILIEELTEMEKKILQRIASGKKRKSIAVELFISERTLSNHLQHIYEKLGVSSSVEAVTKAIQMGYISSV